MINLIGGHACADKGYKPPQGAAVSKCGKCSKMCWIEKPAVELKRKEPNHIVWCSICLDDNKEDPDFKSNYYVADLSEKAVEEQKRFQESVAEAEEIIFKDMLSKHEIIMDRLDDFMPHMLEGVMARLKIWSRIDDLAISLIIRTLLDYVLIRRRQQKGNGKALEGYSDDQITSIMRYVFGVSKALDDLQKSGKDPEDSIFNENWSEGIEHWKNGFFADQGTWGNDFEGWRPDSEE